MGKRLPTILGKAVDDVIKTLNEEYEEEKVIDLAKCIERMHTLMDDLQNNAKLRPIVDDGEGDTLSGTRRLPSSSVARTS